MDDNNRHPVNGRKIKFKTNTLVSSKENRKWIVFIVPVSFLLSVLMQFISSSVLEGVNIFIALLTVSVIIFIGIIFDIIGIAVTAADEIPFHAMASKKLYGARQAIRLIRNANRVSSFCNDVIGDICGVISGTASAYIVLKVSQDVSAAASTVLGLIASGLVAALTVGGKALGKTVAIQKSNYIVYKVSVILEFINGRRKFGKNKKGQRKKERG